MESKRIVAKMKKASQQMDFYNHDNRGRRGLLKEHESVAKKSYDLTRSVADGFKGGLRQTKYPVLSLWGSIAYRETTKSAWRNGRSQMSEISHGLRVFLSLPVLRRVSLAVAF